jgi:hypothetical protein
MYWYTLKWIILIYLQIVTKSLNNIYFKTEKIYNKGKNAMFIFYINIYVLVYVEMDNSDLLTNNKKLIHIVYEFIKIIYLNGVPIYIVEISATKRKYEGKIIIGY